MTPEQLKAAIDELAKAKNVQHKFDGGEAPYTIGSSYLIRTVTHYYMGRIVFVGDKELGLVEACWIADTGRFSDLILTGTWSTSSEIEPIGEMIVGRGAIIDCIPWVHELPSMQK